MPSEGFNYPCSLTFLEKYLKIMGSYVSILPKITLSTISEQGVDPQPAEMVTPAKLQEIEESVREAIKTAQKRDVDSSMQNIIQLTIFEFGADLQTGEHVTSTELQEIEDSLREAIKIAQKTHMVYWYMKEM